MVILLGFAVLAGAGTALSPCVLPVLPAVLSASAAGGARRPLGVVLGLAATFALTVAGVAELAVGTGVGQNVLRDVAVAGGGLPGGSLVVPRGGRAARRGGGGGGTRGRVADRAAGRRGAGARAGAREPAGAALGGERLLVRPRRRGGARAALRAVRRPYPRRGHLGGRRVGRDG